MKKTTIYIVLALLCVDFWARAQDNKAVDVTLKGIQIGQKVPDITINNLHNYKDANGKPATIAKISDFKGKLLILDFWATWCSPCVAMIPKMDSLQKAFGDKIQFLSVTYQNEKEVLPFLGKFEKQKGKHYNLPLVTADKELHKLFPHTTLPHYVWIERNGLVKAITSSRDINFKNIKDAIGKQQQILQEKLDVVPIAYNKNSPLFMNENGGKGENLIYHSILTGYSGRLKPGYSVINDIDRGWKITARDQSILKLFKLAFGKNRTYFGNNRVIIKVKDTSHLITNLKGDDYLNWKKQNHAFNYELIVPPTISGEQAFNIMQEDLKRLIGQYDVQEIMQKKMCLVLTKIDDNERYLSKGGKIIAEFSSNGMKLNNNYLSLYLLNLNALYLQKSTMPLIDETGITEKVDLTIDAPLSNLKAMNTVLLKYGLKFIEGERELKVLLIKDKDYLN